MLTGTFRLEVCQKEKEEAEGKWVPMPAELVPDSVRRRIEDMASLGNNYGLFHRVRETYRWRRYLRFSLLGLKVEAIAEEHHLRKLESMAKVTDRMGMVPAECMAGFFPGEEQRHRLTPFQVALVLAGAKILEDEQDAGSDHGCCDQGSGAA